MNKREFLKILGLSGLGLAGSNIFSTINSLSAAITPQRNNTPRKDIKQEKKGKNWAWITPDTKISSDDWKRKFALMHQAGIDAILPEIYNNRDAYYQSKHLPVKEAWLEKILPLAKSEGLEVHAWMASMPCNIKKIVQKHPEWFVVNRKGESAAVKPAYVDYYKFMCPSHPAVQKFVQSTVRELSQYEGLDGIHLDYIRFPDVILAEGLQPKYHIKQDREYPEYDYCYCSVCQREFKKETGIDIMKLEDPTSSQEWRQFRYDRITHLVNDLLVPVAHKYNKTISAAVFPNWESVRQQWSKWNLDAVLPMLYNNFYNKGIDWIKEETEKGVKSLNNRIPLYSGLFIPELTPDELTKAIEASFTGGAKGVVLFTGQAMTDAHWQNFRQAVKVS